MDRWPRFKLKVWAVRIAEVAPLFESVPPKLYGGTERVVSYLTEALVAAGHDVTLFASGDSDTSATLVPVCAEGLRLNGEGALPAIAHHTRLVDEVLVRAGEFDAIHFHIEYLQVLAFGRSRVPRLTTVHGRMDLPGIEEFYARFPDEPLVSISDSQRQPLPCANWRGTVHHGLPLDLLSFNPGNGAYLAFIGRISPEKRVDRAIEVARLAGIPLRIAAKIANHDREYYDSQIKPLISEGGGVEFVGEIAEHEKGEFLGNALGLLFLIDWPEPFGLAMIEAMACGTPVVACRNGAVPEVIDPGVTGTIVDCCDEAVTVVRDLERFDRLACRRRFEERFSSRRMACDYLQLFRGQPG